MYCEVEKNKKSLDGWCVLVEFLRINVIGWCCTLMVELKLKVNQKLDIAPAS